MPLSTQNKVEFFVISTPCIEAFVQVFHQDPTNAVAGTAQQIFSGQTVNCMTVFEVPATLITPGLSFTYQATGQG